MKNLIYGLKQSSLRALVCKPQHFLHALSMCAAILFVGCDQSEVDAATKLGVKTEIESTSESSISFKISSSNATEVKYLVVRASEGMCDAEKILADGHPSKVNEEYSVKVYNLDCNTPYLICVAAKNNNGVEVAYDIATTSSKIYDEVTLDFSLVRRMLNESYSETEFALLFTDAYPEHELTLVFNAEAGEILPEGSYSTDGGYNATIDAKSSFLSFTNGDEPIYFDRIDAQVQIPHRDIRDKYLITADMYAGDTHYTVVIYDYVGNMPVYDTSNMVFGYPVIREKNEGKCATIIFNTEDEKATLVLETYLYNPNRRYLMPGEYKISSGASDFVAGDIDAQNSWFIANGYYGELVSGVVNVSIDDDYNYIFVIDVEDELGRRVKFEYSGFLPEMYFVNQFTLNSAAISEVESGRYRMEFGGSHNLSFEVCAESLTEGSYPIAEASEALSQYIDEATFSFSSLTGDIAIKRGEMRILQIEEDFVEFSFELHSQDYCIWKGRYHGGI